MLVEASVRINRRDFDAVIFDLDGVLTDTAGVHAAAWKTVFDAFLQRWAEQQGRAFQPFDIHSDYLRYVDGRPRYDGVRSFLAARNIQLPEGSEHDGDDAETVRALGDRKSQLFRQELKKGINAASGAEVLLKRFRQVGIAIAVASSSENCAAILRAAGLDRLIDARIDGLALFLEAARRLGIHPSRAVLFEDALAGVEAGRRGGFGRVIGVDRGHQADALREHGADNIVQSLLQVEVV